MTEEALRKLLDPLPERNPKNRIFSAANLETTLSKTPETPKSNTPTPTEQRPAEGSFEKGQSTVNLESALSKPEPSTGDGSNETSTPEPKKDD